MSLTYASMFTGIGGFDLAFNALGWECNLQVEWDQHCQTLLRKHFPGTHLMGDIKHVRATDLGRPDVYVGGFPCTNTSTAAPNRLGLAGEESAHFVPFVEIIGELDRDDRPEWFVLENPDGILASPGVGCEINCGLSKRACKLAGHGQLDRTGWDLAAITRAVADLGYGFAGRVVDGLHLGSPFRRRRFLLVGHSSGDPTIAERVLGDGGASAQALAPYPVGAPDQTGPSPFDPARPDRDEQRVVWRKSARPRAALSKGGYETWVNDGHGNTLTDFDWGLPGWATHMLPDADGLRVPTILEWERGLGFPDDWTAGFPVTARGGMVGRTMQVGMAYWLGQRLAAVHADLHPLHAVA